MQSELTSCKKQVREQESSLNKKEELLEQFRFSNRSLTAEICELKKDSTCMGQLLEDEVTKVDKIAERERALHYGETELKVQKQEFETQREKLLIEIQANEKLSLQLTEKQDQVDQELERRITNIMENERHKHERALKEAEREIYEVNRSLATMQA